MKLPIFPSSPAMRELHTSLKPSAGFQPVYPWRELDVGLSFPISLTGLTDEQIKAKIIDIRNQSYRKSKQLKRRFKVIYHKEDKNLEVGRLPDIVGNEEVKKEDTKEKKVDFGFGGDKKE